MPKCMLSSLVVPNAEVPQQSTEANWGIPSQKTQRIQASHYVRADKIYSGLCPLELMQRVFYIIAIATDLKGKLSGCVIYKAIIHILHH